MKLLVIKLLVIFAFLYVGGIFMWLGIMSDPTEDKILRGVMFLWGLGIVGVCLNELRKLYLYRKYPLPHRGARPTASLVMFDKTGKVIWRAP